ncbi:MAG: hypothetical protein ACK4E9_19165 [Aeromonas media]
MMLLADRHDVISHMLGIVAVLMPINIGYTLWVYWVARGKMSTEQVRQQGHSLY